MRPRIAGLCLAVLVLVLRGPSVSAAATISISPSLASVPGLSHGALKLRTTRGARNTVFPTAPLVVAVGQCRPQARKAGRQRPTPPHPRRIISLTAHKWQDCGSSRAGVTYLRWR